MCGLVGMAGAIGFKEERVFKTLLELDTTRGPHSTGVLFVNKEGKTEVVKKLGTPWDLYKDQDYAFASKGSFNVLMGHNRWATKGAINEKNAHPFEFQTLVGAHNGTLTSQYLLDDSKNFEVDSENIYHHMEKHGPEATCKVLAGAYALTWYDKVAHSINFLRNDQRDLHYTYTKDRKTLLWASEKWMLLVACMKHDLPIQDIQEFSEHHHYEMVVPMKLYVHAEPFDQVSVRKLEAYTPPAPKFLPFKYGNHYSHAEKFDNVKSLQLHTYLKRELAFEVVGYVGNGIGGYIKGKLTSGSPIEVRVHKNPDEVLWKDLLQGGTFTGIPKSCSYADGGYLNMDCRTVMRDDNGDQEDTLLGHDDDLVYEVQGKWITEKEAEDIVDKGCAWCNEIESVVNVEHVHIMQDGGYICVTCQAFEEVKPYIN